jgi:CBS domain-containing protein
MHERIKCEIILASPLPSRIHKEDLMKTAEDILKEKGSDVVCISKSGTIGEAIKRMNDRRIGAILVKDGSDIVGIWTERDYLRNSGDADFDPKSACVGDHMSSPLHFASHDADLIQLEEMFLGLFLRHIPVEKDGRFIGMISIGDVLRADLLEKDKKIKELNTLAGWQYYEHWGWERKTR